MELQIDPFAIIAACLYFFVIIVLLIGYFHINKDYKHDSVIAIAILFWPFIAFFFTCEFILGSIARLVTLLTRKNPHD